MVDVGNRYYILCSEPQRLVTEHGSNTILESILTAQGLNKIKSEEVQANVESMIRS